MGGAPLANETQKALCERLPRLAITQIYGQTEMGIVTFLRDWYLPAKPGLRAPGLQRVEVAVVDPESQPVEPGEIGEVVARGGSLMSCYYNGRS